MNFLAWFLQLVSGAAGGCIVGCAFPELCLGTKTNSILGIIGGILGGHFLRRVFAGDNNATDMQIFLCHVSGGAAGGALLVLIAGFVSRIIGRRRS